MHHGHGSFDDERHVRRLEAEAAQAAALHEAALDRAAAHVHRVGRVVDLGCGPGVTTALLARRFPGAQVVAADGAPAMLDRVRALAPGAEVRQVDLDGDLSALGSADLVWAADALHHAADEAATLRAVRALLAPQGVLCLLERGDPERWAGLLGAAGLDVLEAEATGPGRALLLARRA